MSIDPMQYLSSLCGRTNQTLTEDEALDWQQKVFTQYRDDQVLAALSTHANRSQFRPQIADVLKLLGAPVTRGASAALSNLNRLVRKYGPYRSPQIDDTPLAMAIEELGGWLQVCQMLPDPASNEMQYEKFTRRFGQVYEFCSNQVHVLGARPAHQPIGLIEAQTAPNAARRALPNGSDQASGAMRER